MLLGIPIAHIHGGELTFGSKDEYMRHAISKLSNLHFVSNEEYRKRLIRMGEQPKNVYNIGSLGVENLLNTKILNFNNFKKKIKLFKLKKPYFVFTYHPDTIRLNKDEKYLEVIFKTFNKLNEYNILFTSPNSDPGHDIIFKQINNFIKKNPDKSFFIKNSNQELYYSVIHHSNFIIGNSSSGIIEAPSLKTPTINLGTRQDGRLKSKSVIDTKISIKEILKSVSKIENYEKKFPKNFFKNPYYKKNSSKYLIEIIKSKKISHYKKFYE